VRFDPVQYDQHHSRYANGTVYATLQLPAGVDQQKCCDKCSADGAGCYGWQYTKPHAKTVGVECSFIGPDGYLVSSNPNGVGSVQKIINQPEPCDAFSFHDSYFFNGTVLKTVAVDHGEQCCALCTSAGKACEGLQLLKNKTECALITGGSLIPNTNGVISAQRGGGGGNRHFCWNQPDEYGRNSNVSFAPCPGRPREGV
jgi:hypothetical protein